MNACDSTSLTRQQISPWCITSLTCTTGKTLDLRSRQKCPTPVYPAQWRFMPTLTGTSEKPGICMAWNFPVTPTCAAYCCHRPGMATHCAKITPPEPPRWSPLASMPKNRLTSKRLYYSNPKNGVCRSPPKTPSTCSLIWGPTIPPCMVFLD